MNKKNAQKEILSGEITSEAIGKGVLSAAMHYMFSFQVEKTCSTEQATHATIKLLENILAKFKASIPVKDKE